ncbi:Piwi-domain-containing protein [Dothidotthia symphoricarpi CBS 119687]|uniref:Piwi-domain-containing protein n=1 Tax=Dothidotthia symphoricarpi CBS 119687 TaxID=1392245 RepID=A0A6A6A4A2_9PLEO|nr:Piwi-domain-containing protein [Dothidotthia symphoricarpi CBS 119687]KAF2126832.1 Piwi-domain-containing protein [Dothidotthia symphoricarpi CBS 119687]
MYYPSPQSLSEQEQFPTDTGKVWQLPKALENRSAVLNNIQEPKYALRERFFSNQFKKTDEGQLPVPKAVLTNHFEYQVTTETFYEYKVIDLGTKNRKKLKMLFERAITTWPFLRDNQELFATNHIDTIVSWKPLHADLRDGKDLGGGSAEWTQTVPDGNNNVPATFRFVKRIFTDSLRQYAAANPNYEHENFDDVARCLNIVISKSFDSEVHKLSSNKFFVKNARVPLTTGKLSPPSNCLEMIRGYFYTVKPGMGNIILNFNISTSAVFRPIRVDQFLTSNDNTFEANKLEHILKGKNVYVTRNRKDADPKKQERLNSEESRYWKVFELQREGNIEDLTFPKKKVDANGKFMTNADGTYQYEDRRIRVVDHLTQGKQFKYGSLLFGSPPIKDRPAVNVGSFSHPVWYAQEHLRIVPYQAYTRPVPNKYTATMVTEAARSPSANRAFIEKEGLRSLGFTTGADAVPFVTRFLQTSPPKSFKYAILTAPGCDRTTGDYYDTQLRKHFDKCGIKNDQAKRVEPIGLSSVLESTEEADLEKKLQEVRDSGARLVFLVLHRASTTVYRDFKNLADRRFGMHSICLVEKWKNEQETNQIMTNVMMKMNLKLGGVNHGVSDVVQWLRNTMVLGADLVHPGSGAFPGTPSIASIVGSVDSHGGKCLGSMRLQSIEKTDREVSLSVETMVLERLKAWAAVNRNSLPDNIIYYRDGVSSGHYPKVKHEELTAIRSAYKIARGKAGLPPKKLNLTAVIVTKRHHTRFYPIDFGDKDNHGNNNCLPGTCVDKLVTSPYYQDFFLQSHSGIKGTARPTHYFILENQIPGMSLEKLRDLTHNLCYSYVRSMSGVSYASPTYYADRLCERGRMYIRKYFNGDEDALWTELHDLKKTIEDAQKADRAARYGGGSHVKSKAEKDLEGDHAKSVIDNQKAYVFEKIESEFYMYRDSSDEAEKSDNPWPKTMDGTMFWM